MKHLLQSEHSFIAFIDESGCHGNRYEDGSSEFLIMSAAILPTWWLNVAAPFDHARLILQDGKAFKKYEKISQPRRFLLTNLLKFYPITTIHVALHKPTYEESHIGRNATEEYAYLIKLTLERISWHARDMAHGSDPATGKTALVFSKRDALPYEDIKLYLRRLKRGRGAYNCSVEWAFIDEDFQVQRHTNEQPVHFADIAASGFHDALKSRHGVPDDRFIRNLGPTIYRRDGKIQGMKFFPSKAEEMLRRLGYLEFMQLL